MAEIRLGDRRSPLVPLAAVVLGVVLLYVLVRFLFPFAVSLVLGGAIYYIFAPVVEWAERRRVPRAAATVVVTIFILGGLAAATVTLVPRVYSELAEVAENLPGYGERAEEWLRDTRFAGDGAEGRVDDMVDRLVDRADDAAAGIVNAALGALTGVVESLFALVFGLVIGFYLLLGGPRVAESLPGWFPPAQRPRWVRFGRAASAVLSGYLRARLLASLFIGTAYGTSFALLGLPDAVLLGAAGGVLNLVPIVGPLLAAIPALLVAGFQGWPIVLAVLAIMVVAQQIESSIIDPHLEGRYVKLQPTVVVLVVALGSALAGIGGLLLAVPIAGLARAALEVFYLGAWTEDEQAIPARGSTAAAVPPRRVRAGSPHD